jgi:hypothetical protein
VFSNVAPVDMATWSALTSPIQVEGLIGSGAIAQDAVAQMNGDLRFRLSDGGIQSMLMARLDFNKWGNTPISKEVSRTISNDDPALLKFTSMANFDNRMLMTCKFVQAARGVYGAAMVALNDDPISSLQGKANPVWDGEWNGKNVMKLITGIFARKKRCYALCLSDDTANATIDLYEIEQSAFSTIESGTPWGVESAMLFLTPDDPGKPREYKRLTNGEFSVMDITGDVSYSFWYRSDQNPNWTLWYSSKIVYQGASDPGYRRRIGIGSPDPRVFDATNNQPLREGYNFQVKVQFIGSCRPTIFRFAADVIPEPEFSAPTPTSAPPASVPQFPFSIVGGGLVPILGTNGSALAWPLQDASGVTWWVAIKGNNIVWDTNLKNIL